MPSTSRPCTRPDQVGWWDINAVHWVIARTKTRSKKSSSGVTCSRSRRVASMRCCSCCSPSAILGFVLGQQSPLVIVLGKEEESERRADQDRDDPDRVGPVVALEERGL